MVHRLWDEWGGGGRADLASVASNGASSFPDILMVVHRDARPKKFYWVPTGGALTAPTTSIYRTVSIINKGADGTGTTVVASVNLTDNTVVQYEPVEMTNADVSMTAGDLLVVKQAPVGGSDDAKLVLPASVVFGAVEFKG